jgi:hypothetical protein
MAQDVALLGFLRLLVNDRKHLGGRAEQANGPELVAIGHHASSPRDELPGSIDHPPERRDMAGEERRSIFGEGSSERGFRRARMIAYRRGSRMKGSWILAVGNADFSLKQVR